MANDLDRLITLQEKYVKLLAGFGSPPWTDAKFKQWQKISDDCNEVTKTIKEILWT